MSQSSSVRRIVIAAIVVLTLLALAGIRMRVRALHHDALQRRQDALAVNAGLTRSAVDDWLAERWSDARVAARQGENMAVLFDPSVDPRWPHIAGSRERLIVMLHAIARGYGYEGAWAIDTGGRIVAASSGAVRPEAAEIAAARDAARSGIERVVGPVRGSDGMLHVIVLALVRAPGVGGRPGVPVGTIMLALDPRIYLSRITRLDRSGAANAWTEIVAPLDGKAVLLLPHGASAVPPPATGRLAALALGGVDTSGVFQWRGHGVVAATRHLAVPGWSIIRAVDLEHVRAVADEQLRDEAVAALLVLMVVVAAALAINRSLRLTRLRALAESEARYRLLADYSTDVIASHAADGRYRYVSPACEAVLGYSTHELVGRSPYEFFHPDDLGAIREAHDALLERPTVVSVRYRYRCKNGRYVWLETSARSTHDEQGNTDIVSVSRDITAHKTTDDMLSRQALLFATISDGVILMSPDGTIVDWNPAAERMFGYTREEVIGKSPELIHHPDERPALERRIREALEREGRWGGEMRFQRKDGESGVADVLVMTLFDARGECLGRVGVNRDITGRRRMEEALRVSEEQLRHAQKMEAIGRLAGGIAHDFNNLLTAISSNAEFALSDLGTDHPVRDEIDEIRRAADRAASLTRQLLAFSRRQVLQPRVLDLNSVILDAERMFRRLIGEHIQLITVLDPGVGCVTADPGQLDQVLLNLVVNARDAMPNGGALTIDTTMVTFDAASASGLPGMSPGTYARLRVSDTGIGMDDETRSRVFEPFFTSKELGKGTGLGLSTTYGIVRQSSGHIYVESALGRGTVFSVYLPCAPATVKSNGSASTNGAGQARAGETVLLVEDEDAVRASVRRMLQRHGYTVLEARHGYDAIRISEEHAGGIDLVITDVVMPELGGRELVERLRARRDGVKVLFMSGYTEDAVATHGVLAQGAAFIEKPFLVETFLHRVRELLGVRG
ncbi:MAG TPA: PAS domain S-box protein [Gemmatimonadaceae bacterium]